MLLFDTPLIGVSLESKLAKEKWNRLEALISEDKNKDWSKSIDFLTREVQSFEIKVEETAAVPKAIPVVEDDRKILPEIAGIIETSDSNGKVGAAVIISGKSYYENEKVMGFIIEKITGKGICLSKGGKSLFIEVPRVLYSVDRGD